MSYNSPKRTPDELVHLMKEKNIRFEHMSEAEVKDFLSCHNNYFRTASYRKNYEKHLQGTDAGKYIDLDFSYLLELSRIDMHLRFLVLKMCLDIEHSLKVQLLSEITANNDEDGYGIVQDFLSKRTYLLTDIYYKSRSTYVGDLIQKYFTFDVHIEDGKAVIDHYDVKCPIWAFMEIITFGDFTKLYDCYHENNPIRNNISGVLNSVKSLRNACAHNNCIIHNLRKGSTIPSARITTFVSSIPSVSKSERKSVLSVRAVYELTALVYLYNEVVFEPVRKRRFEELYKLVNERMLEHADYFFKQDIIKSSYRFFKKIVDFLIQTTYNTDDNKKS